MLVLVVILFGSYRTLTVILPHFRKTGMLLIDGRKCTCICIVCNLFVKKKKKEENKKTKLTVFRVVA